MGPGLLDDAGLLDWLTRSSLAGLSVDDLLDGFCTRLEAGGFALRRGHVSTATVNPAFNAFSVTWSRGGGIVRSRFAHGQTNSAAWRASPFSHMIETGQPTLRRRLAGPDALTDFAVLEEFQAAGMTDWYAEVVGFGWAAEHIVGGRMGVLTSWTTDSAGGFRAAQLDQLSRLVRALAAAIKTATIDGIAHDVLAAYVGRDAATRVLSGAITRGGVRRLRAVLMFADIRGFTAWSAQRPTEAAVALLNDVFDRVAAPITAHGGEILKFIGDGLLAVFLIDERRDLGATVDAALSAAEAAQRAVAAMADAPVLDMALHVGDVHYGNIGAADRLDFTVIGAAVNEVARLEELCGTLGAAVLVSDAVRGAASQHRRLVACGRHRLRDVGERAVFALSLAP